MISGYVHSPANPIGGSALFSGGYKAGVRSICYSVGTKSSPTPFEYVSKPEGGGVQVTISNGIATFDYPQTHPYIGIGDVITGVSEPDVYIAEKIDTSRWVVVSANGDQPADQSPYYVFSIDKAFATLKETLNSDPNPDAVGLTGSLDLVDLDAVLRIACYDTGSAEDVSGTINVSSWITDDKHYLHVFTPTDTVSECNSSQRHNGTYGTSGYELVNTGDQSAAITISSPFTVIEGFRIDGSGGGPGILNECIRTASLANYSKILSNIIKDGRDGIGVGSGSSTLTVRGNIIYDCTRNGILDDTGRAFCVNNTLVDNLTGIDSVASGGSAGYIVNCLFQGNTTSVTTPDNTKVFNCLSDDAALAGGTACINGSTIHFRNDIINDFHLDFASFAAIYGGVAILTVGLTEIIDFDTDIDNEKIYRSGVKWHIGADFFKSNNYFAVGAATDLKTGAPTFGITDGVLTFSLAQTNTKLCVGCVVYEGATIRGYLYKKISDTVWWITNGSGTVAGDIIPGTVVTKITHAFTSLKQAIEDDGGNPGVHAPLGGTTNLINANTKITIACADGSDSTGVEIDSGFVTDIGHFIKIYSPNNPGIDCNSSLRHSGIFNESIYYLDGIDKDALNVSEHYTIVEGIQIRSSYNGIKVSGGSGITIINNIIENPDINGILFDNEDSDASYVINNLIYNASQYGIYIKHNITNAVVHSDHTIYNNTVYGCKYGIYLDIQAHLRISNRIRLINNIVQNSTEKDYYSTSGGSDLITSITNYAQDTSLVKFEGTNDQVIHEVLFKDMVLNDYHLTLYESIRMIYVTNLELDSVFQFDYDYENDARSNYKWDAGVDSWNIPSQVAASYSIGANDNPTLDANPTARTVTITDSILTFSSLSLGSSVGLGDKVVYAGGTCYLAEKGSDSAWYVTDNLGAAISPDVSIPAAVTSITRVANTLAELNGPSGGAIETELGGTRDLAAAGIWLYLWCYDDGEADPGGVNIDAWTTGSDARMVISTPWDVRTSCNSSQRHDGLWTSDGFLVEADSSTCIIIDDDWVRLQGLKVKPQSNSDNGIVITAAVTDCYVNENMVKDAAIGILQQTPTSSDVYIIGNIVFDTITSGIDIAQGNAYNNTVVNPGLVGIESDAGCLIKNCISQGATSDDFAGAGTLSNCISEDATAGTSSGCFILVTLIFNNKSSNDFHLHRGDWAAINQGENLSSETSIYPHRIDIDTDVIGDLWSIGADVSPEFSAIDLYFSIGRDGSELKSGASLTVNINSGIAVFSEAQVNTGLGIGDEVDYSVTNKKCYLYKKLDASTWEVRTKYGINPDDESSEDVNTITHTFSQIGDAVGSGANGIQQLIGNSNNLFVDLDTALYRIHFPVYKNDNYHTEYIEIDNYATSEDYYLRIYVPHDTINECNASQSHNGWHDTGESFYSKINANSAREASIVLKSDYTVIEGLVINANYTGFPTNNHGIKIDGATNCSIIGNIIYDPSQGIWVIGASANTLIRNNIIYDSNLDAIELGGGDTAYNNTAFNVGGIGIHNSATDILSNNIAQNCAPCFNNNATIDHCVSNDSSAGSSNGNQSSITVSFVDSANKDFHLKYDENNIRGKGRPLIGDNDFPFDDDAAHIDRDRFWDVGALEHVPGRKVCYAVGVFSGDIKTVDGGNPLTYSIDGSSGRSIITFSFPQTNPRFGIGNQVLDAFTNGCLILEKIDDSNWVVTEFDGSIVGDKTDETVFQIIHPFNDLATAMDASWGIWGSSFYDYTSLISPNPVRVLVACYNEIMDIEPVLIPSLTTDVDYFLRIFVPKDVEKEVNVSQRHNGNNDTGYRLHATFGGAEPSGDNYGIKADGVDFLEIEGLMISVYNDDPGTAILLENCPNVLIKNNILLEVQGKGISITPEDNSTDVIVNNLIYNIIDDAISAGSTDNATDSELYIYNNTIVGCKRGIYYNKPGSGNIQVCSVINNIVQDSVFQDYVGEHPEIPNTFTLSNNISGDSSANLFDGSGNFINTDINFRDEPSEYYDLASNDSNAIDGGLDLSDDTVYSFTKDIVDGLREDDEWDIGAFEAIEITGYGELLLSSIGIEVEAIASDTPPQLILYLRETVGDEWLHTPGEFQFQTITELNAWIADALNAAYLGFDVNIYLQGGVSFSGTLALGNRGGRSVIVKTDPAESNLGPASIIYPAYLLDDGCVQSSLTFEDLKIYTDSDGIIGSTLLAAETVRFINSILHVGSNILLADSVPAESTSFEVINSVIVYGNISNNANLYLIDDGVAANYIYNSIVIANNALTMTFTTNSTTSSDMVRNVLTYNYNTSYSLDLGNTPANVLNCKPNEDPDFIDVELDAGFDPEVAMLNEFKPKNISPAFNAGNNDLITGISFDIIGNDRIYDFDTVDIGPYEIEVQRITFTQEDIIDLSHDKLKLNYKTKTYQPTLGDKTYKDLYYKFQTNPGYREEFIRESKIILKLRQFAGDYRLFTDKKNDLVHTFEAYYDTASRTILITKNQNLFHGMFGKLFNDDRYVFYFDESTNTIDVYTNHTYDKGLSGNRNVVKNVKIGGNSMVSR